MTTYEELLEHQGGLIKLDDPIASIALFKKTVVEPNCPLLYLGLSEEQGSYSLFQKRSADESNSPTFRITVRLFIDGRVHDVHVYPPRIQLL